MLQLFTANFNLFKLYHFFPNFDALNAFPQNSTGPWSLLQNSREIPEGKGVEIAKVDTCPGTSKLP